MPFGLTNILTMLQHLSNDVLLDLLDQSIIACLDDSLTISEDPDQHLVACLDSTGKIVPAWPICKMREAHT